MNNILTELNIDVSGTQKRIINVPAHKCSGCDRITIDDLAMEKVKAFAEWESSQVVDYAQCEQNEAEIFTVLHTFGNLLP